MNEKLDEILVIKCQNKLFLYWKVTVSFTGYEEKYLIYQDYDLKLNRFSPVIRESIYDSKLLVENTLEDFLIIHRFRHNNFQKKSLYDWYSLFSLIDPEKSNYAEEKESFNKEVFSRLIKNNNNLLKVVSGWKKNRRRRAFLTLFVETNPMFSELAKWLVKHGYNELICFTLMKCQEYKNKTMIEYTTRVLLGLETLHFTPYYAGTIRLAFTYLMTVNPDHDYFRLYHQIIDDYKSNYDELVEIILNSEKIIKYPELNKRPYFKEELLVYLIPKLNFDQSLNLVRQLRETPKYSFIKRLTKYLDSLNMPFSIIITCYNYNLKNMDFWIRLSIKKLEKFCSSKLNQQNFIKAKTLLLIVLLENKDDITRDYINFLLFLRKFTGYPKYLKYYFVTKQVKKTLQLWTKWNDRWSSRFIDRTFTRRVRKHYFNYLYIEYSVITSRFRDFLPSTKIKLINAMREKNWDVQGNNVDKVVGNINEFPLVFKMKITESLREKKWHVQPYFLLLLINHLQKKVRKKNINQLELYYLTILEYFCRDDLKFYHAIVEEELDSLLDWIKDFNFTLLDLIYKAIIEKFDPEHPIKFKRNFILFLEKNVCDHYSLLGKIVSQIPDKLFTKTNRFLYISLLEQIISQTSQDPLLINAFLVLTKQIEQLNYRLFNKENNLLIFSLINSKNDEIRRYGIKSYLQNPEEFPPDRTFFQMINVEDTNLIVEIFKFVEKNKTLFQSQVGKIISLINCPSPLFREFGLELYQNLNNIDKIAIIKEILSEDHSHSLFPIFINDLRKILETTPSPDLFTYLSNHPNKHVLSIVINDYHYFLLELASKNFDFVLQYCQTVLFSPRELTKAKFNCFNLLKELFKKQKNLDDQNRITELILEKAKSHVLWEKEEAILLLSEIS